MIDQTIIDQGFQTLRDLWDKTRVKTGTDSLPDVAYGFWHAGNTLDTFMDYLARARPVNRLNTAITLGSQGVTIFNQVTKVDPTQYPLDGTPPTVAWWDDYGWWGIAFLKVHFMTGDPRYLHAAEVCWHFMDKGGRQYSGPPGSEGGTWNHDPSSGGIQNVITNALFLILSARLYISALDGQYLTGALLQYKWFAYQLDNGAKAVVPGEAPAWLIHQLPLGQEENFWTGDQGSLLGGLASLSQCVQSSDPNLSSTLLEMCKALAQGATTSDQMVWPVSWNKDARVVHEAEPSSGDWRFDLNGSTGKGVLMRYLGAYYDERNVFIVNNAEAVARTLPGDGYFGMSWVGDPQEKMNDGGNTDLGHLTRQSSGQDAMNAWLLSAF